MLKINEEYLFSFVDISGLDASIWEKHLAKPKKQKWELRKMEASKIIQPIAGGGFNANTGKVEADGGMKWLPCKSKKKYELAVERVWLWFENREKNIYNKPSRIC